MPTKMSATDLPARIQKLLEERQHHTDTLARIDETLTGVTSALGDTSTNGKEPATTPVDTKAPAVKGKKRRRGRGRFAVSAEESILAFVKQEKNPASADIGKHLKAEGRSTSANNALGKLVEEKKLKRTPLGEGMRGSR